MAEQELSDKEVTEDKEVAEDKDESVVSSSNGSEIDYEMDLEEPNSSKKKPAMGPQKVLSADHPLMIKYQHDLKQRLLSLLQEADEQIYDLTKMIKAQEKENDHFAKQGYEFQQELDLQEEKLKKIYNKCDAQVEVKNSMCEKCRDIRCKVQDIEKIRQVELKKDSEGQKKLEEVSFEVVQLTSLQNETLIDAKSLQRAVEKTAKDKENLELQKLRQDLLISRLENDKYTLEDKINLYKTQWAIKKEEVTDLRKELNAAYVEMEIINFEKQQIVHQWKQSLASLEKQDRVLSEIRVAARAFEDDLQTLKMEIAAHKKLVRKELERNELLTMQLQFKESDIARTEKELQDVTERESSLLESLTLTEQIIEITENELKYLNDTRILKEKEVEAKERDIQKCYSILKSLEEKHIDVLHEKMTVTKASKYTEKIIKDTRNSIRINEDKSAKKESEREKLLLQVNNLKTVLENLEKSLDELQKECKQRSDLLDKSEANVVKTREKMDVRRNECKNVENELQEMIVRAGGQELAPFERELANVRKEINVAEQGKREMEGEYLRYQRELFTLSKQKSVRNEENDLYKKKLIILEGKKHQIEADISKEEKNIKDTQNRIQQVEKDLAQINKLLYQRKELQEYLKQATESSKTDFNQTLKEAELNYLQKQSELQYIRRKKRKLFSKVMELQKYIVFWEQKLYLVEETRKILKSEDHIHTFSEIKSEIRRLQLKQEQIKKDQEHIVQEMSKSVYRHTSLYVEADKQALYGKRRKTPEYVKKRIKNNIQKLAQDKKALEMCYEEMKNLKAVDSQLEESVASKNYLAAEMMDEIMSIESDTDEKQQLKRQAVLKLSFKQKKNKCYEKFKDRTYIRAMRNEGKRAEEILKLQNAVRALQVIIEAAINEYPSLEKELSKVLDYIIVSKEI